MIKHAEITHWLRTEIAALEITNDITNQLLLLHDLREEWEAAADAPERDMFLDTLNQMIILREMTAAIVNV